MGCSEWEPQSASHSLTSGPAVPERFSPAVVQCSTPHTRDEMLPFPIPRESSGSWAGGQLGSWASGKLGSLEAGQLD